MHIMMQNQYLKYLSNFQNLKKILKFSNTHNYTYTVNYCRNNRVGELDFLTTIEFSFEFHFSTHSSKFQSSRTPKKWILIGIIEGRRGKLKISDWNRIFSDIFPWSELTFP